MIPRAITESPIEGLTEGHPMSAPSTKAHSSQLDRTMRELNAVVSECFLAAQELRSFFASTCKALPAAGAKKMASPRVRIASGLSLIDAAFKSRRRWQQVAEGVGRNVFDVFKSGAQPVLVSKKTFETAHEAAIQSALRVIDVFESVSKGTERRDELLARRWTAFSRSAKNCRLPIILSAMQIELSLSRPKLNGDACPACGREWETDDLCDDLDVLNRPCKRCVAESVQAAIAPFRQANQYLAHGLIDHAKETRRRMSVKEDSDPNWQQLRAAAHYRFPELITESDRKTAKVLERWIKNESVSDPVFGSKLLPVSTVVERLRSQPPLPPRKPGKQRQAEDEATHARILVDITTRTVMLDGERIPLKTDVSARYLKYLSEHQGEYVKRNRLPLIDFETAQVRRIRKQLPSCLQKLLDSKPGPDGGTRLVLPSR